jgi:UDP-2,3-diacylglucosamine pyrophosphatase LpxH
MEQTIAKAIIVSDLHIGLPQFHRQEFLALIESLDTDTALVLNGDTIDRPGKPLMDHDQEVVDFIRDQSFLRTVIWLSGNHADEFPGADTGRINTQRHLQFGNRLLVMHGDDFDDVKPRARWFLVVFSHFHKYLVLLGAPPVHVAEFAKRWLPFLYRVLTKKVRAKAVLYAKKHHVAAIACGHTHSVEDSQCDGVRYINTGSWTEFPLCYIKVNKDAIELIRIEKPLIRR